MVINMGDILSYIDEFGGFTFVEKPLCEADGLILAHLSYYVYDEIVPGINDNLPPVYLYDLPKYMKEEEFISVKWELEKNRELFKRVAASRRYRNVRLNYFVNEIDLEEDVQFCAVTFLLGNGDIYISFRGTDDELIGWKEDFYMAYRTPVGSQIRSVNYVNKIAEIFLKKRNAQFYFGGHSKGGNLAVYAAMQCDRKLRHRILKIYNFDGPGFRPEFMEELDYENIKEKVVKFVPDESFIGLLMEQNNDYILIKSTKIGMAQHIALTWYVEGDSFLRSECNQHKRKDLYAEINNWILAMDREKVGEFLDNLFSLIEITEARTLSELKGVIPDFSKKANLIKITYKKMDEETKRLFWEMGIFMIEVLAADQQERVRQWKIVNSLREKISKESV